MTLKSFRFVSTEKKSEEETNSEDDVEECVVSIRCEGNCDHLPCRMKTMQLQGGRRTSPASEPITMHICPQCGLSSNTKKELQNHVQRVHNNHHNCPFCEIGFYNLSALKNHIELYHKEIEPTSRPSVITQKVTNSKAKAICVFNLQPNGCKKGSTAISPMRLAVPS